MSKMQMHRSPEDARAAFRSQFDGIDPATSWMGLMLHVAPDGMIRLDRTTWDFPIDRAREIIELLKRDFAAELGVGEEQPLLPIAPGFGIVADDQSPADGLVSVAEAVGDR